MSAQTEVGRRVLVAGIGNVFLGDDGFGVEVAQRLAGESFPPNVVVRDFGFRGIDLTYALLDGYDAAILVDAAPRGGAPGTIYVIEPRIDAAAAADPRALALEAHSLNPDKVLSLVHALGGNIAFLRVVGCEPESIGGETDAMSMGLSEPVRAAIDPALLLIRSIVLGLLRSPAFRTETSDA